MFNRRIKKILVTGNVMKVMEGERVRELGGKP